jgi:hypothetical protein
MIDLIPIDVFDYAYQEADPESYFFSHMGYYYGYLYSHRHPFRTKEYKEFQSALTRGISEDDFKLLQRKLKLELI